MSLAHQGFYTGYLCKIAEGTEDRDDLPRKTWWNLLPGHALEEAGRGKALFEAQGRNPHFSVKHPKLTALAAAGGGSALGGVAGRAIGGIAGAIGGIAGGSNRGADIGSLTGGAAGGLAGLILALRTSLKHTHEQTKYLEDRGITPEVSEQARRLLKEKADKSRLLHSMGGLFVGNIMHGRTSQLRKLTGEKDLDEARLLASLGLITAPIQGWKSVSQARRAVE